MPVAKTLIIAYSMPVARFFSFSFSKSCSLKDVRMVPVIASITPPDWRDVRDSLRNTRLRITVITAQQAETGLMIDTFPTCRPLQNDRNPMTLRSPVVKIMMIVAGERIGSLKKSENIV